MLESKYLKANLANVHKLMEIPMMKDFETCHLEELLTQSKLRKYKDGEQIIKEGKRQMVLFCLGITSLHSATSFTVPLRLFWLNV